MRRFGYARPMQDALFPDLPEADTKPAARRSGHAAKVRPAATDAQHHALAASLPSMLRLGTSSWSYPGWRGRVWDGDYSESVLAKHGLAAYAAHPLLQSVSVDRSFYRPLSAAQYAAYAAQVPDDFRFLVKAPGAVTDALVRDESGRALQPNPLFLDPEWAIRDLVQPALDGLRDKLGALVFQLGPLPPALLAELPAVLARLTTMLQALRPAASDAVIAVQVRDPEFLTPDFATVLRAAGATYCLGLHAKMPTIEEQLPMLRALWPGPLVCRWNLHRRHGPFGYEAAQRLYEPYERIADADPDTRRTLAKVALATCAAGHPALIAIGNKAEGSAPLSVVALAEEIAAQCGSAA
jgi:uncharacterized protein YecE (DUF72 family)